MINITEETIDSFIEKYDDENQYLTDFKELFDNQLDLMAFIDHENYTLLTNDEVALMEYLTTIIFYSCQSKIDSPLIISGSELEKSEEKNWDTFNQSTTKNFTKILDTFFTNYPQEDLLALVEDSIQQDEESIVTSVGREIIFVACKSIIDAIHANN